MGLATYSDLTTSVANWLHRSDLTSIIPDLVTIAEGRLSADLKARDMDTDYTVTLVAGTSTAATPLDMVELRRLQITSTDPRRTLTYVAPDQLSTKYPYSTVGMPEVFTVLGNKFEFAPIPDAAYTVSGVYSQRIPSLQENTTNWLMTKWPHAYLYATLCASAPYLGQDQRVDVWEKEYQKAVDNINSVDWFSGSPLVVRRI